MWDWATGAADRQQTRRSPNGQCLEQHQLKLKLVLLVARTSQALQRRFSFSAFPSFTNSLAFGSHQAFGVLHYFWTSGAFTDALGVPSQCLGLPVLWFLCQHPGLLCSLLASSVNARVFTVSNNARVFDKILHCILHQHQHPDLCFSDGHTLVNIVLFLQFACK